jgi:hypothetical protein
MEKNKHEAQILYEIDKVMELYYRKYSPVEIARITKISQNDVKDIIESVKATWRDKTLFNFEEAVQEEVQTANLVIKLAFSGFEKSKKNNMNKISVKRVSNVFGSKDGKEIAKVINDYTDKFEVDKSEGEDLIQEVKTTNERTPGNKAYLDIVLSAMDKKAKLLGLYAPIKSESKSEKKITGGISYEHLTEAERKELKEEFVKELIAQGKFDINQLLLPEKPVQIIPYNLPPHLKQKMNVKPEE